MAITEKYFSPNYFDKSLTGARADQEVLKELIGRKLPSVHHHLDSIDVELSTITLNWFLAMFFDAVPFQVVGLVIWHSVRIASFVFRALTLLCVLVGWQEGHLACIKLSDGVLAWLSVWSEVQTCIWPS